MSIQEQLREMSDETQCMKAFVRFAAKVEVTANCWIWTHGPNRYGQIRNHAGRSVGAHVFSYELFIGPVPHGLEIDHVCRNTRCVNPRHLEPVTHQENMLRRKDNVPCCHGLRAVTHCDECRRERNALNLRVKRGGTLKPHKTVMAERWATVAPLLEQGVSITDIAKRIGVERCTIYDYKKRFEGRATA